MFLLQHFFTTTGLIKLETVGRVVVVVVVVCASVEDPLADFQPRRGVIPGL